MLVSLGSTAADLGTISLVTVCVYAGNGRPVEQALMGGLLAFGGGLLQTAITLALWPWRRHGPERELLAGLMTDLQHMAQAEHMEAADSPPATGAISGAQQSLSALNYSNTIEAERLRSLLAQGERIRISLVALRRLRSRIRREPGAANAAELLDEAFRTSATALGVVAATLSNGTGANQAAPTIALLDDLASRLRHSGNGNSGLCALIADARTQVQALSGRLRAVADLAAGMTAAGAVEFDRTESRRSPALRLTGTLATIRANLHLTSTTFRHAVRLAVCVATATALGREIGFQRAYWMPMTAAIVLKPDFTATFTRGILRIGGTFLGLLATTGFFYVLPAGSGPDVALAIALMFAMRWAGGANYGILVVAVTGLVVALLAMTGVAPGPVMAARAMNTVIGGVIALVAYAVWPTWQRTQVREALASTLDSYRDYFDAICFAYQRGRSAAARKLNRTRVRGRLARTNLEATAERLRGEPGNGDAEARLAAVLATSHRMVHAMMSLEAGLEGDRRASPPPGFEPWADAVKVTLSMLSDCLRSRTPPVGERPNIRELHTEMTRSGDRSSLLMVETDRITNTLDTIAEQVLAWAEQQ